MNMKEIGMEIYLRRQKLGLTQKDISKKTGFTTRTIRYWENGEREISLCNADRLFKVLKLEMRFEEKEV